MNHPHSIEEIDRRLRAEELERMVRKVGLSQVLKDLQLVCELREQAYKVADNEPAERAWHSAAMTMERVAPRCSIIGTEEV